MDARDATPTLDRLIADLAERQHGVVEHGQLIALGLGRGAIAHRLRTGRLHHVHRGVYAVGHRRLTAQGRRMAAVLACGPGALVSHATAGDAWGIRPASAPAVHVTVPSAHHRRRAGVVVHRTRRLRPSDAVLLDGIPVTSVARTLLDLAEVLDAAGLRKAVERAERLRLFDGAALDLAAPGRATRRLAAAVGDADPGRLRSDLESDFLALCRRFGLPRPEVNAIVAGLEVDFLWRGAGVAVEVDGWAFHGDRRAFVRDRRRDVRLALEGLTVLRFTHDDVHGRAEETAQALRALGVASRASM